MLEILPTLWLTLWTAVLAVLIDLPIAIGVAWLFARHRWFGKSICETLLSLPLVLPPVATGLILLKILSPHQFLGSWLDSHGIQVIFTWKAVVLALAVMAFPILVRSIRTALEEVPNRYEHLARTLGASRFRAFRSITLPLAKRGILAGILLAFARAIGEFGATMMVAGMIEGETKTLSLSIYQSVHLGNETLAFQFVGLSLLFAFVSIWLSERMNSRHPR